MSTHFENEYISTCVQHLLISSQITTVDTGLQTIPDAIFNQ
jgi:hypothetical protein